MLFFAGKVSSELSQSETATNRLIGQLTSTKNHKHGQLHFGYHISDVVTGGLVVAGSHTAGMTTIDLAFFDENGNMKADFVNVDPRSDNLARVFEHEHLLGHDAISGFLGIGEDGGPVSLGGAERQTNISRRERGLMESWNYSTPDAAGRSVRYFGHTSGLSRKDIRKTVKSFNHGKSEPTNYRRTRKF
jgi:hypothetical protein